MHTLATIKKTKEVKALVAALEAEGGKAEWTTSTVTVEKDGKRMLSAINPVGAKWSVMVTQDVADKHNLPLWKDL